MSKPTPAGGTAKAAASASDDAPAPSSASGKTQGTGVRLHRGGSDEPGSDRPTTPGALDALESPAAPASAVTGASPTPSSWADPEDWEERKREMERRATARIAEARRKAMERRLPGLDKLPPSAPSLEVAPAPPSTSAPAPASTVGEILRDKSDGADPATKPSLLVPAWMEEPHLGPPADFDDAWSEMLEAGERPARLPDPAAAAPAAAGPETPTTCVQLPSPTARAVPAPLGALPKPATSGALPASAALPKPATSGALPTPVTTTAPPKAAAAEAPRRTAWDEAVARTNAEAPAAEEPAAEEPAPREARSAGARGHAWDAVLRQVRPSSERDEDDDGALTTAPSAAYPPPREDPAQRAAELFDEGFGCLRRGDANGALRSWREAHALDPENGKYQANLRKLEGRLAERHQDHPTSTGGPR